MTDQPKASDLVAEARRWADDCDRSFYSSPFEKDAATLIRRLAAEVERLNLEAKCWRDRYDPDLERRVAKREAHLQTLADQRLDHWAQARNEVVALKVESDKARTREAHLRDELRRAAQFCTWLCEDSNLYKGTALADHARRLRVDLRKALAEEETK